ncbi:MAG: dockerin type I repeat-containing protein [Oscillospiraceae bacterium]|nr:dockerin type I repeat-containing protein [Oscillospiraceae bacterium]
MDGEFTIADAVLLQKWLLAVPGTELPDKQAGDLYEDGRLNVLDMCVIKQELLNK